MSLWGGKPKMGSLIEELQLAALNKEGSVSDLLRKARLVAVKLGVEDSAPWIDHELNGYENAEPPDYREIVGEPRYFNRFHGWQQIGFEDHGLNEMISRQKLGMPIGELEALVDHGDSQLRIPYPPAFVATLEKTFGVPIPKAGLTFSRSTLARIIDLVRSRVLDWAVRLEKAGVRGEGMTFSDRDKALAAAATGQVTYNIGSIGSVAGAVGSVSHGGSVHVTQFNESHVSELLALTEQVRKLVDHMGLSANDHELMTVSASDLEAELGKPEPSKPKVKGLLTTMRSIAENVAGNVIASGILTAIDKIPL